MPWKLAAAAVSGGLGLADTAVNNYYNKKAAKQAYERDIAFWKMQNEYNTPANQMARLKEAGLNPNLIYGNITPGNSSSSVHAQPAQRSSNFAGIIDNLLRWKKENEENKLLEEQNVQAVALTKKAVSDATAAEYNSRLADATLQRYLSDNNILGIGRKGFALPSSLLNNPNQLFLLTLKQQAEEAEIEREIQAEEDRLDNGGRSWWYKLNKRLDPNYEPGSYWWSRK